MRYKILLAIVSIIAGAMSPKAVAQEQNDTIYNPRIVYTGMPQKI